MIRNAKRAIIRLDVVKKEITSNATSKEFKIIGMLDFDEHEEVSRLSLSGVNYSAEFA